MLRDRRRCVGRDDGRADPNRQVIAWSSCRRRRAGASSSPAACSAGSALAARPRSARARLLRSRARRASGRADRSATRSVTSISFHASRSTGISSARWRFPPWRAISSTCALKMFFDALDVHCTSASGRHANPPVEADRASVVDVARQDHDGRVRGEPGKECLEPGLVRRPALTVVLRATLDAVAAPSAFCGSSRSPGANPGISPTWRSCLKSMTSWASGWPSCSMTAGPKTGTGETTISTRSCRRSGARAAARRGW